MQKVRIIGKEGDRANLLLQYRLLVASMRKLLEVSTIVEGESQADDYSKKTDRDVHREFLVAVYGGMYFFSRGTAFTNPYLETSDKVFTKINSEDTQVQLFMGALKVRITNICTTDEEANRFMSEEGEGHGVIDQAKKLVFLAHKLDLGAKGHGN